MDAVVNKAQKLGVRAGEITIGVITGTLDMASKGISLLSSIVKGEKKVSITVEEVKK